MSQTTYLSAPKRASAGMLADSGAEMFLESLACEDSDIPFGLAVVNGTDPETQVKIPTATGQALRGFLSSQQPTQDALVTDGLSENEVGSVVRRGRIWVKCAEAVAVGDTLYFVYDGATAGQLRNDNTNADAVGSGVALKAYDSVTGLALLEVNLP